MDVHYLQDKDMSIKLSMWELAEDMQDANPHFLVGWWGFIMFLMDPCILSKDLTTNYTFEQHIKDAYTRNNGRVL